jgi:hypothetical protein
MPELDLGRNEVEHPISELEHVDQPISPAQGQFQELDDFVLGSLQSKILIALLLSKNGSLSSGQITKRAGISASSWAKVKIMMIEKELLNCKPRREIAEGRVIGSVEVRLTRKGVFVAQNLLLIATMIGKNPPAIEGAENFVSVALPIAVRAV